MRVGIASDCGGFSLKKEMGRPEELQTKFGFEPDRVVTVSKELLAKK